MAAPFYSTADQAIYEGGNKFIPQEQYRLGPFTPPAIMGQNTNAGIASTDTAQSYKSPYIWPPVGGGGGGGQDETEEDNFSMGMSPGALGGKLPGFGNWAKRTVGDLGHIYSNLPTPTNLLRKGIMKWKENREIKKQEKIAAEKARIDKISQQSQAGAGAIGPRGGGAGDSSSSHMGGISQAQADAVGAANAAAGMSGWGLAEGGRIGYRWGESVDPEEPAENIFEIMQDQNIPFSEQVEGDPFEMRIQELMGKGLSYDDAFEIAEQEFQHLFSEGSEQDQGIASLV